MQSNFIEQCIYIYIYIYIYIDKEFDWKNQKQFIKISSVIV